LEIIRNALNWGAEHGRARLVPTSRLLVGATPAAFALAVAAMVLAPSPAAAQQWLQLAAEAQAHEGEHAPPADAHAHEETDIWAVARGGQLYDNWAAVLEVDLPEATHPAYPAEGRQKGGETWRCVECHGWDYKGRHGAYGQGSHYTGIRGIREMVGLDRKVIHEIIQDETHRYTEDHMPHAAMEKLALFVSRGQADVDLYIDRATREARGDARRGAAFFQTICAVCHGFDGKAMNFKDEDDPEYIGTIAKENPWMALHKIQFGQPGVGMVALTVLELQNLVDILAYAQTLPAE
jgi:thiosulfate dehydrogenase